MVAALKGAATLKARTGGKNRLKGIAPVLPIEDSSYEMDLDLEKYRSTLAKGAELGIETPDGKQKMLTYYIYICTCTVNFLSGRRIPHTFKRLDC